MLGFHKTYSMNKKDATDTLSNVFDACNVSHNSVPFDKIMLRSMAETKFVTISKYIGMAFLVICMLVPLTFRRDQTFSLTSGKIRQPIVVVDHQLYDKYFVMVLFGNGIDWDNIHCVDETGAIIYPSSIDNKNGTVIFPCESKSLNIYIPDVDGSVLQGLLSTGK